MKLDDLKNIQLDEGVIQNVFNYLWTATGKVLDSLPVIGDKRKEARVLKHYDDFVNKMDDAGTKKFISDLTSKIKSTHSATQKAMLRHVGQLTRQIEGIKKSTGVSQYISRSEHMHTTLRNFKNFIRTSNKGVSDRKYKAKDKAKAKAGA